MLLRDLHSEYSLTRGYNFEVALTGSKAFAVATAMMAATTSLAAVYHSEGGHDPAHFTRGVGQTMFYEISLEREAPSDFGRG